MEPRIDVEFWLHMLACQAIMGWLFQRHDELIELRGIEQATIDAEFWEIVNAG